MTLASLMGLAEGIAKLALNIRQAAVVFLDNECYDQAQSFINAAKWIEKVVTVSGINPPSA